MAEKYFVIPYVRGEDGRFNMPFEFWERVYSDLLRKGRIRTLFHEDLDQHRFLKFIDNPKMYFCVVFDMEKSKPIMLAWLSDIRKTWAMMHYAHISNDFSIDIVHVLMQYWHSLGLFRTLVGIIPSTNRGAISYIRERVGFIKILGEIPGIMQDQISGDFMPGTIVYVDLMKYSEREG